MVSPTDIMAEYVGNLEKKQRNLLKRKAKLETYREVLRKGGSLTADQEKAVAEYESVCQLLESIKETSEVINELQVKVDRAVKENEEQMESMRKLHTVNVIRKVAPILELLAKVQLPAVKAAILTMSSPQQFRFLEQASKILNVRIPSGFDPKLLDTSDYFKTPAEYLYQLANGTQVSVSNKNSKSRTITFAELRNLCYNLLLNESVRSALNSPLGEQRKEKAASGQECQLEKDHSEKVISVERKDTMGLPSQPVSSIAFKNASESVVGSVINPLKTNFNFLQPSCVLPTLPAVQVAKSTAHDNLQSNSNNQSVPIAPMDSIVDAHIVSSPPVEALNKNSALANPTALSPAVLENFSESKQNASPLSENDYVEKLKPVNSQMLKVSEPSQSVQPPSLQAVIDAELAQQNQSSKATPGGVKSWADRVRGAPAPQSFKPTTSLSFEENNEHKDHNSRGMSEQLREPREHRPLRPSNREEVPLNVRSGGSRGTFRGTPRGRGAGMQGRGRGRGNARGGFLQRNGCNGQGNEAEAQMV